MSLRWQLLALSLLTLALPWAGCQYAREMESVLRSGLAQTVQESATTMARALDEHEAFRPRAFVPPGTAAVYAPALIEEPRLDGYRDDWSSGPSRAATFGQGHRYRLGIFGRALYAHLELHDPEAVYPSAPGQAPYGDRVLLRLGDAPRATWLLLHTAAPGQVRAVVTTPPDFIPSALFEDRVIAAWADTAEGYAVEIRLPLALAGERFGLAFVDVDSADSGLIARLEASWTPIDAAPPVLRYPAPSLHSAAEPFRRRDRQLRIVDRDGWLLFDGGSADPQLAPARPEGLAGRLYRWVLDDRSPIYTGREEPPGRLDAAAIAGALQGEPSVGWFRQADGETAVVLAAVPVRFGGQPQGALLLEQDSAAILSLTDRAAAQLVGATALASSVAALALFGYAALLSLRVRRLARGAQRALGRRGEILPTLPGRAARDEIGDLARSFTDLLLRVRAYNEYLKTLGSKLAHELRTPLAVASTSLDNVESELRDDRVTPYLGRLREGLERLDRLIQSMSEATALEQAVANTPAQRFALHEVVAGCVEGYRRIHPTRRFALEVAAPVEIEGAPELVAQLLDKLTDNAVQFSPPGSTIAIALERREAQVLLRIANTGSPLPAGLGSQQLFESMVSVRGGGDARGHLGLGLYIAALVARYHGADIDARDRADGSGVEVSVAFPLARRPGSTAAAHPESRS